MTDSADLEPTVRIGLPVYNGENYLREAIESVLSQTYPHLELAICDNASIDTTAHICQEYVREDPRVRYYRNVSNIGLSRNFNRLVGFAGRTEYFMWMAHDDVLLPGYVSACVGALNANPDAAVAYTCSRVIDSSGSEMTSELSGVRFTSSSRAPDERFEDAMEQLWTAHGLLTLQYGVVRTKALRRSALLRPYPSSDSVFLAEMALIGQFVEVPQVLYERRLHKERVTEKFSSLAERARAMSGETRSRTHFTHWRYLAEYVRMARTADTGVAGRLRCFMAVLKYYVRTKYRSMFGDLCRALVPTHRSGS